MLGAPDSRSAPSGEPAALVERASELHALDHAVAELAAGRGGIVMFDAPAGLGKTVLLEHAATAAQAAGCTVRWAHPSRPERDFHLGVLRTLLEAPVRAASDSAAARLRRGPSASATRLLVDGELPGEPVTAIVAHSILWLCATLAAEQPLVLVLDDAQWADRGSLEVLSYLARRIDDAPVLILVAARPAASGVLAVLGGGRRATILHPQPLTRSGAVALMRRMAPDTSIRACCDAHQAAAGNPWLLGELARQIGTHGPELIERADPDALHPTVAARDTVRRRLAELDQHARAIAAALAVTGDGATAEQLASTADTTIAEVGHACHALAASGLLAAAAAVGALPAPAAGLRFAHPLIAAAIRADLPASERERLHRAAAYALCAGGAAPGATTAEAATAEVAAAHLMRCRPLAEAAASKILRRAASGAAERGDPRAAAAYLERALGERVVGDDRAQMLAQLATVTFDAGLPDAVRWLREAVREPWDPAARAELLTRLAALGVAGGGAADVPALLEDELAGERDPDVRARLQTASLDVLTTISGSQAERIRRVQAIELAAVSDAAQARAVLAHRAWLAAEFGAPDAGACAAMAVEALTDTHLVGDAWHRLAGHLCVRTLVLTDRFEHASRAIDAIRGEAAARGSLRLRAAAAWYAAELALRTGRVADAERHARLALDDVGEDINAVSGGAAEVLICAHAERGAFEEARALLRARGLDGTIGRRPWEIGVLHARAVLWLAEGDFERAERDAREAGRLREQQGRPNPTWTPWRSTASLALAHRGRFTEAIELADAELLLAERFGAPVPVARALHARAVAAADDRERVALCERALSALADTPALLERIRLRLQLGSTLTHRGRRIEARDALRPALADADAAGAVLLARRARRELVATGLRPRRAALEGVGALTPRQRQICELAAAGRTNRAIAQELFLSIKTVETHLAASYRKLGVSTRGQLAVELAR